MANEKVGNKRGMGGSRAGRGRPAKTAAMKAAGRKSRRREAAREVDKERVERL